MNRFYSLLIIAIIFASCNRPQEDLNKDISVPVTVVDVQPKSIEKYIEITGSVKPVKEVKLKAEMSGHYKLMQNPQAGRPYVLGDIVKEGEELISLEDVEYENNIKLNSIKLNLEITKQVFEKQQSLFDKGGVTLSELKNAESNYINAKYAYDDALLRLQKMHIKAPFTGAIVDLPYNTPQTRVDINTALVSLMDYSKLYMETNLAEKNMSITKPGQMVKVTNYIVQEDTLVGTITELSPAIDPDTRSYKGMIIINNPNLKLRPGMYAKGEIIVASADKTIVVPKDIIVSKQRGNYVYVVEKGIAYERAVQFGLENPKEVQITSGLKLNEKLVIKGFETLRDKSKIKVVK
jgi:membrane fusion protein, multidrug efflux system